MARRGSGIVMAVKALQERQAADKAEAEANNPVIVQVGPYRPPPRPEPPPKPKRPTLSGAQQRARRAAKEREDAENSRLRAVRLAEIAEEARELEAQRSAARLAEAEALRLEEARTAPNRAPPDPIALPAALRIPLIAPPYEPAPPLMPAPDVYPGVEGELQQTPLFTLDDSPTGLGYETNMAAFEAQDPFGRNPARANVGYASTKAGFRR